MLQLDVNQGQAYTSLAAAAMAVNRLDEASAALDEMERRGLDNGERIPDRYALSFLRHDDGAMHKLLQDVLGKPAVEDAVLSAEADTEAYYGHAVNARNFTRRAIDSAVRNDAKETAALWQAHGALRAAEFGFIAEAKREAIATLALPHGRNVQRVAALALARAGEMERSKLIATELSKRFPLDTIINGYWLPTIRAAAAVGRKNASEAVGNLDAVQRYELGVSAEPLYPVYLRATALVAT